MNGWNSTRGHTYSVLLDWEIFAEMLILGLVLWTFL